MHPQPGIVVNSFTYAEPYIGDLSQQLVVPITVLTDALATDPLVPGTLMAPDVAGKYLPFTAATVAADDAVVVLWQEVTAAALVAGDVASFAHVRGDFRRSLVVGYLATQEVGLNVLGIYTKDAD